MARWSSYTLHKRFFQGEPEMNLRLEIQRAGGNVLCTRIRRVKNGKQISGFQDKRDEARGPRSRVEGMAFTDRGKGFRAFDNRDHRIPARCQSCHIHNCEEQVTILEGEATAIIDGTAYQLTAPDTTFISQGLPHRFINNSNKLMKILWVYTTTQVTRTFVETGKKEEYLKK
jgi:mannose-6-phosphate isomerase-like protein (cupin superfamily)